MCLMMSVAGCQPAKEGAAAIVSGICFQRRIPDGKKLYLYRSALKNGSMSLDQCPLVDTAFGMSTRS